MILAVDPGLRGCGCAILDPYTRRVVRAAYVANALVKDRGPVAWRSMAREVNRWAWALLPIDFDTLLLEVPKIYPKSDQRKGDLNDLLELAGVQGAIANEFPNTVIFSLFPRDWKGTVKKSVMTERIRKALTDAERNCISWSGVTKDHNTLDAVGIGLHRFGRLNRRVYGEADPGDAP